MGRCVFGERVWCRVGPLTDRTKADDRVECGIIRRFPDEGQRAHFDCKRRSDNCSDNLAATERCNHELDEAPLYRPPAEAGPSQRVEVRRTWLDQRGHSVARSARMEEVLQGTAIGPQRLEEAERRTRDTAGERAAERIKLRVADRPVDPACSSSARILQVLAMSLQGVSLKMRLKTP